MRVALLGNMNNNFFTLTRYLRELGFDAHLFMFPSDPAHFQPEADSFAADHKNYVHLLNWGNPFDLLKTSVNKIRNDVEGFSFFIGCGTAPAYLAKAGIQLDLVIPYGSDLYDLPFFKLVRPSKLLNYYVFTAWQKKGIRTARNISIADTAEIFDKCLAKIGFAGKRLFAGIPMVYHKQYASEELLTTYSLSSYYTSFKTIRQEFDFVIFHNSRHCWKTERDPVSLKDNDKLFRGLASFRKKFPSRKVALVTFEYGKDVAASKQLVKELKLEKNVFWFPLMARKEIMIGMQLSDIVAGEFKNSWFTYGVVFESMVVAKPIMHFRDDKLYEGLELYPMIYAREVKDIENVLAYYIDRKDVLAAMGNEAKQWYIRNIVTKSMRDFQKILRNP